MPQLDSALIELVSAIALGALLALAVKHDAKSYRIPNWLTLSGALIGCALHALLPRGEGLFDAPIGGSGLVTSLEGLALGLGALLPMYALRAMGAGDVKLMAAVGAFLGPLGVLNAVVLTFLAGGVLAVVAALWRGSMLRALQNVRFMLITTMVQSVAGVGVRVEAPAVATGKLPYAIAIAAGTLTHLLLARAGHALIV